MIYFFGALYGIANLVLGIISLVVYIRLVEPLFIAIAVADILATAIVAYIILTVAENASNVKEMKARLDEIDKEKEIERRVSEQVQQVQSQNTAEKTLCIVCGAEHRKEDMFCPHCGTNVNKE